MRLELRGISKRFGEHSVLDGVSADFADARSIVFIGPSGGGKSTLLRIIAGLETPDGGEVLLDGARVAFESESRLREHRRRLGVVFQAFNLFPHLSALENIVLPLEKVHGKDGSASRRIAMEALERFQLGEHAGKQPGQLSGGQKQRVAIARALAVSPEMLLFDEPTSALDPEMTAEVLEAIEQLKADGRRFVLVTHAMGFARRVADTVAFLADGRIVESGSPEKIFADPSTPECRSFLSRVLRY
jgi:polar amino acid transport system ATP-binding protein